MDAHGVNVFDGAYNDAVVGAVAHDFHLKLFPAKHGLFNQHFADGGGINATAHDLFELITVISNAAARTAKREGWADDEW